MLIEYIDALERKNLVTIMTTNNDTHKEVLLFVGGEYQFVVFDEEGNMISMRPASKDEITKAESNAEKAAKKLPKIDGEDPPRW